MKNIINLKMLESNKSMETETGLYEKLAIAERIATLPLLCNKTSISMETVASDEKYSSIYELLENLEIV